MYRAQKYNEVYDDHGQTMSRDSREDVCALMTEYIENFEPVLSEAGKHLFEDEGDASEPAEVVTLDDL